MAQFHNGPFNRLHTQETVGRSHQGAPLALAEGYDTPEPLEALVERIEKLSWQPFPSLVQNPPLHR